MPDCQAYIIDPIRRHNGRLHADIIRDRLLRDTSKNRGNQASTRGGKIIQWEKISQGRTPTNQYQIDRVPPDTPGMDRAKPLQDGHAPPEIPARGETGQIRPHTFAGLLASVREDPLVASLPRISTYSRTKDMVWRMRV